KPGFSACQSLTCSMSVVAFFCHSGKRQRFSFGWTGITGMPRSIRGVAILRNVAMTNLFGRMAMSNCDYVFSLSCYLLMNFQVGSTCHCVGEILGDWTVRTVPRMSSD